MAIHALALALIGPSEKKDTKAYRSQIKGAEAKIYQSRDFFFGLLFRSCGPAKPVRGLFFVCADADLHVREAGPDFQGRFRPVAKIQSPNPIIAQRLESMLSGRPGGLPTRLMET